MGWAEVAKELGRAYDTISTRQYNSPTYLKKLKRAFVKKEIQIGYYAKSVFAEYRNIKTLTVFKLESSEFCSVNLASMFRYKGHRYLATYIATSDNQSKVLIFTKHFLDRYLERNNTKVQSFEELARHILINERMATMELNGEYSGKVITLSSGIGLSNSEHTDSFIIINTYVNNTMLKGDQVRKYSNGLDIAKTSDEIEYEMNHKKQFG